MGILTRPGERKVQAVAIASLALCSAPVGWFLSSLGEIESLRWAILGAPLFVGAAAVISNSAFELGAPAKAPVYRDASLWLVGWGLFGWFVCLGDAAVAQGVACCALGVSLALNLRAGFADKRGQSAE